MEISFDDLLRLVGAVSKQEQSKNNPDTYPWVIGNNYLIRTITMIDTGKLIGVTPTELILIDAAWIADTGRWNKVLKSCEFNEVEPFPDNEPVIINRSAIIDAVQIMILPKAVK